MSEYTLDELEKFEIPELQQAMLFGNTIKEMKLKDPSRKVSTWLDLNKFKIVLEEDNFKLSTQKELLDALNTLWRR